MKNKSKIDKTNQDEYYSQVLRTMKYALHSYIRPRKQNKKHNVTLKSWNGLNYDLKVLFKNEGNG